MADVCYYDFEDEVWDAIGSGSVRDGDVVACTGSGAVGFIFMAWPVRVSDQPCTFTRSRRGLESESWDAYRDSITLAQDILTNVVCARG